MPALTLPRAITLDLDDTLWPVGPTLVAAEKTLTEWLQSHAPRTGSTLTPDSRASLRKAVLADHPDQSHDLGFLRREVLRRAMALAGDDTVASLALANSASGAGWLAFWHASVGGMSIEHWVNDGLMAIFFLMIGLELERALYVGGIHGCTAVNDALQIRDIAIDDGRVVGQALHHGGGGEHRDARPSLQEPSEFGSVYPAGFRNHAHRTARDVG